MSASDIRFPPFDRSPQSSDFPTRISDFDPWTSALSAPANLTWRDEIFASTLFWSSRCKNFAFSKVREHQPFWMSHCFSWIFKYYCIYNCHWRCIVCIAKLRFTTFQINWYSQKYINMDMYHRQATVRHVWNPFVFSIATSVLIVKLLFATFHILCHRQKSLNLVIVRRETAFRYFFILWIFQTSLNVGVLHSQTALRDFKDTFVCSKLLGLD